MSNRARLLALTSILSFLAAPMIVGFDTVSAEPAAKAESCDTAGLSLPKGFCATIFAAHVGHARHLAVGKDGTVYVNTWSGRYYNNDTPPDGGFLVAMKDTTGDGKADKIDRFGTGSNDGNNGGTGIALYGGKVFAETNDKIVAYKLKDGELAPSGDPETIVSGMPLGGDHPMHPFVISPKGEMFVDMGSATNACQPKNRMPQVPGNQPCTELETRGGTWMFDANKTDQAFSPDHRFATGLRNGEGFAFDSAGRLFATQHGRDQLFENWPQFYKQPQGADLPSEEVVMETKGADFGWPFCYFDPHQKKLILAPEYGGDGKKVGQCEEKTGPAAYFPAHWAPNDLAIYSGDAFPSAYKDALIIAFHGSWNRAPAPQDGYNVVVQPMKDGKANGPFKIFADGFAGPDKNPGQAIHRPTGVAVGPDGSLYIADDVKGTIWRVTYQGDKSTPVQNAKVVTSSDKAEADALPPEGIHPNAGLVDAAMKLKAPDGTTKQEIALGARIFDGQDKGGTCAGCHGNNAKGTPIGPNLIKNEWLWGDGSLAAISNTIQNGVAAPKQHSGAMPPMGGATLSGSDVKAVAAYVYALNHQS